MPSILTQHFLPLGYKTNPHGADLLSPDGRQAYEIKLSGRGVRDLRDSAFRLATFLATHPNVQHGYLLASLIRISQTRLRAEWSLIKQVLLPAYAARMNLVAVVDGILVADPSAPPTSPVIDRFLEITRKTSSPPDSQRPSPPPDNSHIRNPLAVTWKHLEIEKILLNRWLLHDKPIPLGVLSRQVGCSYPTAHQAIRQLSANDLIRRGHGRSVALAQYPRDRWTEILRAQRLVYPPERFVDPTADPGAVDAILKRLNRSHPKDVALGGVLAARRLDPSFDLNGTPRIDLLLHTPLPRNSSAVASIPDSNEFVHRLDPALKRQSPNIHGPTVLVLHRTFRHDSLFQENTPIPFASPVDVLFHLNDLGLTAQAAALLRHLRQDPKS
jgi:hypothetical protein